MTQPDPGLRGDEGRMNCQEMFKVGDPCYEDQIELETIQQVFSTTKEKF